MSDDPYKITPHPPSVQQVCQRCGALVGHRVLHDAWHDTLDKDIDRVSRRATRALR